MNKTQNLQISLLKQGQLNKDITINEALMLIDSILNSGLESLTTFDLPPTDIEDGKLILVGREPMESFEGFAGHIAFYTNGWNFLKPKEGLLLWVKDIKSLCVFDGQYFVKINVCEVNGNNENNIYNNDLLKRVEALEKKLGIAEKNTILTNDGSGFAPSKTISEASSIGINTSADAQVNKLSVRSDNNLFASETGDVRFVLNKLQSSQTSSFIFQSNWQGRAEFGNIGGDNFILKVSADGVKWLEVFEVDCLTGKVNFKQDVLKNGIKIF